MTMKLIIRYSQPWGNTATQTVEIDKKADVDALQEVITKMLNIPKSRQVLKTKVGEDTKLLGPGQSLSHFFPFQEKAIIFLETSSEKDVNQLNVSPKGGSSKKLGVLSNSEEAQNKEHWNELYRGANSHQEIGPTEGSLSKQMVTSRKAHSEEERSPRPNNFTEDFSKSGREKEERKKLIAEVKANHLQEVQEIIRACEDEEEENRDTKSSASSKSRIKKLVNWKGETGWSAFHWAIYFGYIDIIKELLKNGADVNIETQDGWTSLQLAVHTHHIEVMKLLLKHDININRLTNKGTALHIAVKSGKTDLVAFLLNHGADIRIRNKEGFLPSEFVSTESIKTLIEMSVFKNVKEEFHPPKPPVVKGFMFKRSAFLLKLNMRYFVMDPNEGTLIRYKKIEDYPNKPKEIIPLKKIDGVRRMKAGPLYNKNYHYIQLLYQRRYILACHNERAANQWVTNLIKGVLYCNFIEKKLQEISENTLNKNQLESKEMHQFLDASTEELEILDVQGQDRNSLRSKSSSSYHDQDPLEDSFQSITEEYKQDRRRKDSFESMDSNFSPLSSPLIRRNDKDIVNFQSFRILKTLGSGTFGKVYKVEKKDDGKIYAMKVLKKKNLIMKNHLSYAITEANVLKMTNHPFVLGMDYSFQTPFHLYLVLDYCPGGDLSLHLANKNTFTEDEVRFYIAGLVLAFEYLHSLDIIYRDLKPENILIDERGYIKLADFGLSKEGIGDNDVAMSFCGSPAYLSPEMLNRRAVGKAADIYGIGTVMYELLAGASPYYSEDIPSMYHNIKKSKLQPLKGVSKKAQNLVSKLLSRDAQKRPGVIDKNELKKDPFFSGLDWKKLARQELPAPRLNSLKEDDFEIPMSSEALFHDVDYTEQNKHLNRVKNFTFAKNKSKDSSIRKNSKKK